MSDEDVGGTVGDEARVLDVLVAELHAELHHANPCLPMRLRVSSVRPEVALPGPGSAVFTVCYTMALLGADERVQADIRITLAVPCRTGAQRTHGWLVFYARRVVIPMLQDYLREHLHWLTAWMGLPPLVIDLFTPGDARTVTESVQIPSLH